MIDQDDLNQEAALRLLLVSHDDLTTQECLHHARNAMRAARRRQATYDRYVGQLEPRRLPDGEVLEIDEYLPAADLTPEEAYIAKEARQERLEALRAECRQLLVLLETGFGQGEAAEVMGRSEAWSSRRMDEIRDALR